MNAKSLYEGIKSPHSVTLMVTQVWLINFSLSGFVDLYYSFMTVNVSVNF